MEDLQKNEANLLTLPRSDVGLPLIPPRNDNSAAATEGPTDTSTNTRNNNTYPCLLLLQLPPQWKAEDLKDARFVIPDQQASMVVEGQKKSFVLQRVETSNALVLVPPPTTTKHKSTTNSRQDGNDNVEQQESSSPPSPQKRRKITTTEKGLTLRPVQARLLNQGSGAFFLEAKTESLRLTDLVEQLPVWDPYQNTADDIVTVSTEFLGNKLAKSQAEILQGLRDIQALSCEAGHCRLAEEAKLDVLDTVIATLVEAFPHFISEGIPLREFCNSARVRLPKTFRENERVAEILTKYCLGMFLTASTSSTTSNMVDELKTTLQLDIAKVGTAVASRILTRQNMWEESLFLDKWQEEMPGVDCKISTRWLVGHAVRLSEDTPKNQDNPNKKERETTYYWKYLPCSAVVENAKDSSVVWERLIQAKQTWTAVALEPYLDAWQRYKGELPAAILRHAAIRTEGDIKIYHAR